MLRLTAATVLACVMVIAGAARAHETRLGDLAIEHAWARASVGPAKAGAVYLTIVNRGSEPDQLVGAETPAARAAAPHTHTMAEGVMKMRPVAAIEVAPGEPTVLRPGGLHIMLIGLTAPLVEGKSFPLTLIFAKAGTVDVEVMIEKPGAMQGTEHTPGS